MGLVSTMLPQWNGWFERGNDGGPSQRAGYATYSRGFRPEYEDRLMGWEKYLGPYAHTEAT